MNTTTTNPNIVIRNINTLVGKEVCPTTDKQYKVKLVARAINPSKYTIVGMVDRTNNVVLETRFHNIRDMRGRFAKVKQARR